MLSCFTGMVHVWFVDTESQLTCRSCEKWTGTRCFPRAADQGGHQPVEQWEIAGVIPPSLHWWWEERTLVRNLWQSDSARVTLVFAVMQITINITLYGEVSHKYGSNWAGYHVSLFNAVLTNRDRLSEIWLVNWQRSQPNVYLRCVHKLFAE